MLYLLQDAGLYRNQIPTGEALQQAVIGPLPDATACTVERNKEGLFSLSMAYLQTGLNAQELILGNAILSPVGGALDPQIFLISSVEVSESGLIHVEASHISYNANYIIAAPFTCENRTNKEIASYASFVAWLKDSVKQVHGDEWDEVDIGENSNSIDIVNAARYTEPISLREALLNAAQGRENAYLEASANGPKIHFNIKKCDFENMRFMIRYGRNLSEFKSTQTTDDFFTHVLPYVMKSKDGFVSNNNEVYLRDGVPTFFSDAGVTRIRPLNLSGQYGLDDGCDMLDIDTAVLIWIKENPFTMTPQEISVGAIPDDGNSYELGAVGKIIYDPMEIETTAAITSLTYDVLEDRVTSIGVGQIFSDVTDKIARLIKGARA